MGSAPASHQPITLRAAWPAIACAVGGAVLFQFFGNANRGYIDTASLFYWWGYQWVNPQSELEHAWLIFGLSAWLFWRNIRNAKGEGPDAKELELGAGSNEQGGRTPNSELQTSNWAAVLAMIAGLLLHAVGFAAQQARLSIIALLVFTWGVLGLAGGRRWGAAAVFPLGFLLFAIPISVLDSAGFWLRMWVINASSGLAHAAGINVVQSGTQLLAPDGRYNYDVAAACSGVRSLTALAALSLLAGYLTFRSWWRRGLVLLLCFPLVYIGNVARIASIVFAAQLAGPAWGDRVHTVMGFGVFVIVLGGVLGGVVALQRWWPERKEEAGDNGQWTVGHAEPPSTVHWRLSIVWLMPVIIIALTMGEMMLLHHLANAPARGDVGVLLAADGRNPVELPAFVGSEWIGRRAEMSAVEREILPQDTGFTRKIYVSLGESKHPVLLSVVLSGRDRTSIHRPELCLVGQGWTIAGITRHEFRYPSRPGGVLSSTGLPGSTNGFPATMLQIRREVPGPHGTVTFPHLAAYWFVDSDSVVATHWERIARDAWNRVAHARVDRWAYVLMQTDSSDGEAAALGRMQEILDGTLPAFQRVFAVQKP